MVGEVYTNSAYPDIHIVGKVGFANCTGVVVMFTILSLHLTGVVVMFTNPLASFQQKCCVLASPTATNIIKVCGCGGAIFTVRYLKLYYFITYTKEKELLQNFVSK